MKRFILFIALLIGTMAAYAQTYNTTISGELNYQDTRNLVVLLDGTTSDDTVNIYINSPGGSVFLMMTILHSMNASKAHIVTYSGPLVASAATLIFFNAKEHHIDPISIFIFHTVQSDGGAVTELAHEASDRSIAKAFHILEKLILGNLLTEPEYYEMFTNGQDMWFIGADLIEREKLHAN